MHTQATTILKATSLAIALVIGLGGCTGAPEPSAGATLATSAQAHPDVHRFRIGQLEAIVLRDGDIRLPNDGSIVAQGQPPAERDALLERAGLPTDALHLSIQSLLVRTGDRVILFDTGAGAVDFADGGRLPQSLRAAGIEPGQVSDILISHAHPDHIGGLLDTDGRSRFPNASVRLSAPEWEALQSAADNADLAAAIAAQVETFEPGAEVLPGVTSVPVDGHTPGHSAYRIVSGGERLLYLGDSAHHHVISVRRPGWTIAFDGDAPIAKASREALLARAADEALPIHSPHFPFPGLGRIERQGEDFVWVPRE